MKMRPLFNAVVCLAVMTLFGCGGGGGGGGAAAPPAGSVTISGIAAEGPLSGSDVAVFNTKADGSLDRTTPLGTTKTGADGSYTITIPPASAPSGPVVVEVSGGAYIDEVSGQSVTMNATTKLRTAVSSVADGDKITVTPLTEIAYHKTEGLGNGATFVGAFTKANIDDSNTKISSTFGVDNIIRSHPFDPTKAAPANATADDKKYAAALGVFSQMVNDNKGSTSKTLATSLDDVLNQFVEDLHTKGGLSPTTVNLYNTAIDNFKSKNNGGTLPSAITFKGGVLTLVTAGTLATGTAINGIDFTVSLPAGVTVKADAVTGEAAATTVQPSSLAAANSTVVAKYTPAAGATPGLLHVTLLNVQPGFALGEFAHINFDGFPAGTDSFTVTVNQVSGGSDPKATPATLTGITIPVDANSLAGL